MDALTIYKIISDIYNSLVNTSVLSMLPFLILTKTDERGDLCRFKQWNGDFYSRAFPIGDFIFKDIVILTPFRYFYNKRILNNIIKYLETGNYTVYISFVNPIKIRVSLFNRRVSHIVKYDIKLFSAMFDGKLFDWFTYTFLLTKKDRLLLKQKKLQERITEIELLINTAPTVDDLKEARKETSDIINMIKKKQKEKEKEIETTGKNESDNKTFDSEEKKHKMDIEKMGDKRYNDTTITNEDFENIIKKETSFETNRNSRIQ